MMTNISRHRLSILILLFFLVLLPSYSLEESEQRFVQDYLDAEKLVSMGFQASRLGDLDFAKEAFQLAIEKYPDYDFAHYGLGLVLALNSMKYRAAALAEFEILRL